MSAGHSLTLRLLEFPQTLVSTVLSYISQLGKTNSKKEHPEGWYHPETAPETGGDTLLSFLRCDPHGCDMWSDEEFQRVMLECRHEFPQKLRVAIRDNETAEPRDFCRSMLREMERMLLFRWPKTSNEEPQTTLMWGGFDGAIDSEEEFEISIRMFPFLLHEEYLTSFLIHDSEENRPTSKNIWPMWSPKLVPFAPAIAEVIQDWKWYHELLDDFVGSLVATLVATDEFPASADDAFRQQMDKVALAALVRLRDKDLLTEQSVIHAVSRMFREGSSSWNVDRVRFLIDCHPLLFRNYLQRFSSDNFRSLKNNKAATMKIIETLFQVGMVHYPEDMGFLFYTDSVPSCDGVGNKTAIEVACDICGREAIIEMIHNTFSRCLVYGNLDAFEIMVWAAINREDVLLDALYLLVRLDPVAVCSLLPKNVHRIQD